MSDENSDEYFVDDEAEFIDDDQDDVEEGTISEGTISEGTISEGIDIDITSIDDSVQDVGNMAKIQIIEEEPQDENLDDALLILEDDNWCTELIDFFYNQPYFTYKGEVHEEDIQYAIIEFDNYIRLKHNLLGYRSPFAKYPEVIRKLRKLHKSQLKEFKSGLDSKIKTKMNKSDDDSKNIDSHEKAKTFIDKWIRPTIPIKRRNLKYLPIPDSDVSTIKEKSKTPLRRLRAFVTNNPHWSQIFIDIFKNSFLEWKLAKDTDKIDNTEKLIEALKHFITRITRFNYESEFLIDKLKVLKNYEFKVIKSFISTPEKITLTRKFLNSNSNHLSWKNVIILVYYALPMAQELIGFDSSIIGITHCEIYEKSGMRWLLNIKSLDEKTLKFNLTIHYLPVPGQSKTVDRIELGEYGKIELKKLIDDIKCLDEFDKNYLRKYEEAYYVKSSRLLEDVLSWTNSLTDDDKRFAYEREMKKKKKKYENVSQMSKLVKLKAEYKRKREKMMIVKCYFAIEDFKKNKIIMNLKSQQETTMRYRFDGMKRGKKVVYLKYIKYLENKKRKRKKTGYYKLNELETYNSMFCWMDYINKRQLLQILDKYIQKINLEINEIKQKINENNQI